ncbi:MAG: hypothetical protein A3F46_00870 [Legionellales bacterium RIFCSPHIGHO2_12_FULL_42_9]|nr:MAG: hypothetical protein A3F46_00870 [Legionellales bacterium RIFCSPHIGHO2_12_FULL_42_9]
MLYFSHVVYVMCIFKKFIKLSNTEYFLRIYMLQCKNYIHNALRDKRNSMSKTVHFLEKKWNAAINENIFVRQDFPFDQDILSNRFYAAAYVLFHYGAQNKTQKEQTAMHIGYTLADMLGNNNQWHRQLRALPNKIGIAQFYRSAIMQSLRFISPDQKITDMLLSHPPLTNAQKHAVDQELLRELNAPTPGVQTNFLGVMISYFINEFTLTPGNSGFASACFVVAKKCELQNIAYATWEKMINAANFSIAFWERGSNYTTRRIELNHADQMRLRRIEAAIHLAPDYTDAGRHPVEAPPPYEMVHYNLNEAPPDYSEVPNPDELPPAWTEEDSMEVIDVPHAPFGSI